MQMYETTSQQSHVTNTKINNENITIANFYIFLQSFSKQSKWLHTAIQENDRLCFQILNPPES